MDMDMERDGHGHGERIACPMGDHGTISYSPDHVEAAGPVGPAVDRVLPFVIIVWRWAE